jgi:hypothetical protein
VSLPGPHRLIPERFISFSTQVITIVHNPRDFRLASYSYLANVYSLLISALISNDAVFVTVSPATLYLQITTAHALFRVLPINIVRETPNRYE